MFTSHFVRVPAILSQVAWSVIGVVSGIHAKFTSECMHVLEKDPSISIFQHPNAVVPRARSIQASVFRRHMQCNPVSAVPSTHIAKHIAGAALRSIYTTSKDNDVTRAVIRLGKPDTVRPPKHIVWIRTEQRTSRLRVAQVEHPPPDILHALELQLLPCECPIY